MQNMWSLQCSQQCWSYCSTWRHLFLLANGVIPGELDTLVRLNAGHTQELHTLHAVTCCLCVIIAAHTHLSQTKIKSTWKAEKHHLGLNKNKLLKQELLRIIGAMTNLTGFLHSAARHLCRVLDKKIIQYVHLPAFLSAYWTSNCTYWSQRSDLLLKGSLQNNVA